MRNEIKIIPHLGKTSYVNLCKSILHLEQNIFFVGIINNNGRLVDFAKKAKQDDAKSRKHRFGHDMYANQTIHINANRS
jgi:hypothetical protein